MGESEFNLALGQRLELMRRARRISQDALGARLGVTGQQIYKYESGENRLPAEAIAACARIFRVPVGYFFGETDIGEQQFDKAVMHIAAEVDSLPAELKRNVYTLSRSINKHCRKLGQSNNDDERAA